MIDQLGHGTGVLDTGRAGPDDSECQQPAARGRVIGETCLFEAGQEAGTKRECLAKVLQPDALLACVLVPEVVGHAARGEDQVVVIEHDRRGGHTAALEVDACDIGA